MDKVKTVSDVENHRVPVGERVVVCGGGIVGLECAVMLGMEGKQVTVIDQIPLEKFADGMPVFNHIELNYQLEKYGVTRMGGQKITSFGENGVETVDASGEKQAFAGDTYVLALGVKPDNRLAQQLLSAYAEGVYVVALTARGVLPGSVIITDLVPECLLSAVFCVVFYPITQYISRIGGFHG